MSTRPGGTPPFKPPSAPDLSKVAQDAARTALENATGEVEKRARSALEGAAGKALDAAAGASGSLRKGLDAAARVAGTLSGAAATGAGAATPPFVPSGTFPGGSGFTPPFVPGGGSGELSGLTPSFAGGMPPVSGALSQGAGALSQGAGALADGARALTKNLPSGLGQALSGVSALAGGAPIPFLDQSHDIAFSFWCAGAGRADLRVTAFTVDEALFGLTRIEVLLTSAEADIDLQALMDTKATLTVHHKWRPDLRHFSGIVMEAERGDTGHHRTAYRVVLLPSLARLDHGSDCRIFQEKTVPDILKQVLAEYGIEDVRSDLAGDHQPREYCVQYRETHLAFLERLMSEEGIFYYFTHGPKGGLTLVLKDTPEVLDPCPGQDTLTYNAMASGVYKDVYCSSLTYRETLRSGACTQRDYTFKNPPYSLEHTHTASETNGLKGQYKLYDYPGRYKKDAAGKPFTRNKLEATRVDASLAYGIAGAPHLISGHAVTLQDHPNGALNIKWRLLTIRHEGFQPQATEEDGVPGFGGLTGLLSLGQRPQDIPFLTGAGKALESIGINAPGSTLLRQLAGAGPGGGDTPGGQATLYSATFTAQPARLPYRPPQRVRPMVDGPQIAHVVGPPGEEIFTDEFGRVKVWFPWDRHGEKNEKASCWIRVASNWAGAMWGHIAIPRIGHEVIVDFLEGDPDQPIITGRTYHAQNMPPYPLPDHKTKMVIRSDTHKGSGFNEMSFEDQAGQENMFFHAQKDQTIKVLNNRTKRVNNNQVESIGKNKSIDVGKNHQEKIGGSMNVTVGSGGGALLGMLGGLVGAAASNMTDAAAEIGNPVVLTTVNGITGPVGILGEGGALGANTQVAGAGNHFGLGGFSLAGAATSVGGALGAVFPLDGVLTTTVDKVQSTTVGLMTTEQTGLLKNTLVGHTELTSVGKKKVVLVGEDYDIEAKESIFSRTTRHTMTGEEKIVIGTPGATLILDKNGLTIKAKKIVFKCPDVDFQSGNPDGTALSSDMPYVEDCGAKAKG